MIRMGYGMSSPYQTHASKKRIDIFSLKPSGYGVAIGDIVIVLLSATGPSIGEIKGRTLLITISSVIYMPTLSY